MRAFALLPSNRRLAGVIAFALMVLSAFAAVHHHGLAVPAHEAAFAASPENETGRTGDCFVCSTPVSASALVPQVSAPRVVLAQSSDSPAADPALDHAFRPSAPRAPPAA